MVFCYKLITEAQRSGSVSPRKRSPCKSPELSRSISELIKTVEYSCGSIIDDIPERDWRLLATLARKRDMELEQEKLSHLHRKMWDMEQEERNMISAECSEQYRRYLEMRREGEQLLHQYKTSKRQREEKMKQQDLLNYIKHKDMRSSNWLHWTQDKKFQMLTEKATDHEIKTLMAIDRKIRHELAEDWKRHLQLEHNLKRVDMARQRKEALLKDASRRKAINNALDLWESALIKHEVEVMKEYRRAQHLANAQQTKLRSERIAQERNWKQERARRIAKLSAQLRECVLNANSRSR